MASYLVITLIIAYYYISMKPVNAEELNQSYKIFSLNFVILTVFSLFCVYLFFAASGKDYDLLNDQMNKNRVLLSKRKEINKQFDIILLRFGQLSNFRNINSTELDNQSILLQDIQNANFTIRDIVQQQQQSSGSFLLYKKMTDDVVQMAGIQDSLLGTRFQIESAKNQLESCLKVNHSAGIRLSSGLFRR
jgi:hypothetical protein